MVDRMIYCFWTGDNPITPNRVKGLESMRANLGVPIEFLDKKGIEERILPEAPLHPAYKYLSCIHQSDYLRCYFMHHFGGGYADIKPYTKDNNWVRCFDYINANDSIQVIGMHEVRNGGARQEYRTPNSEEKLLANGFFVVRPYSDFSTRWYNRVKRVLDARFDDLKGHPSTEPFGGDGYSLRWAEVQGEPFHDTIMEMYDSKPWAIRNVLKPGWIKGKEYR